MTLEIRPAATIVLLRQGGTGVEVLLVQRRLTSAFGPGAWVFPGGAVDAEDSVVADFYPAEVARLSASMALGADEAASYLGAALREVWEETGILVGGSSGGESPLLTAQRTLSLPNLLAGQSRPLDLSGIIYLSRWLTPPGQVRRYDTRFFLAEVGDRVEVSVNEHELSDSMWTTPEDALARNEEGGLLMMRPTLHTLRGLSGHATVTGMLRDMRERPAGSYLPGAADESPG